MKTSLLKLLFKVKPLLGVEVGTIDDDIIWCVAADDGMMVMFTVAVGCGAAVAFCTAVELTGMLVVDGIIKLELMCAVIFETPALLTLATATEEGIIDEVTLMIKVATEAAAVDTIRDTFVTGIDAVIDGIDTTVEVGITVELVVFLAYSIKNVCLLGETLYGRVADG